MSLVLSALSFLLLFLSLYFTRGKLISPSVISCFVIGLAAFIGYVFEDSWQLELTVECIVIVFGGLLAIFVADAFSFRFQFFHKRPVHAFRRYDLDDWFIILYMIFVGILFYQYWQQISAILSMMGKFDVKSTEALLYLREAELDNGAKIPATLQFLRSIINCFFIVSVYCFIYNIIFCGFKKKDLKFLIPILGYSLFSVINASRIDFLGPFFYAFSLCVIFYQFKEKDNKKILRSVLKYGGTASVLFLSWFALLRYFRGGDFQVFDHLARYIAGGLYDFAQYEEGNITPFLTSTTFGAHTFNAWFKLLEFVGLRQVDALAVSSSNFVTTATGYACNVYTAFAPLVEDFDVAGCWFILFLSAFSMGLFRNYIYQAHSFGLLTIFYAETCSAFYMIGVVESLFTTHIITPSRIAHFLLVFLFLKFMNYRRSFRKEEKI